MCFAGIETEIRNLPERELPVSPKPVDPDPTVPRTLRLSNAPVSATSSPAAALKPSSGLLPA